MSASPSSPKTKKKRLRKPDERSEEERFGSVVSGPVVADYLPLSAQKASVELRSSPRQAPTPYRALCVDSPIILQPEEYMQMSDTSAASICNA